MDLLIGNTYLLPRLEPRAPEDPDGIRGYVLAEYGHAWTDGPVADPPASGFSRVHLNGGRLGWMAKARRMAMVAAAFLLAPLSRRAPAGRTAPNLVSARADGDACGDSSL